MEQPDYSFSSLPRHTLPHSSLAASLVSPVLFTDSSTTPPTSLSSMRFSAAFPKRPRWWWWWWSPPPFVSEKLSRRALALIFLLLCVLAVVVFWAVQYLYREGPFMAFVAVPEAEWLATQLSPSLDVAQLPFLDLCIAGEVMEKHVRRPSGQPERLRQRQLATLMDRFHHIPAHGGEAAVEWSMATGLPVAHKRRGVVQARFVTASDKLNDYVHIAATAATMAGVQLEMVGKRWRHFSFLKRMGLILSFAEQEGLSDADVLVGMDSDALLSGEDMYSFLEAFVASTAASEAEHGAYAVRDIRLGKRMPPFLFSGEYNCMRDQMTRDFDECRAPYQEVDAMMSAWAARENVTLPSYYTEDVNPLRFFNAGVFVARVWAVRLWNTALLAFVDTHAPAFGTSWWCDQSSMSAIYLELRRWELLSGALQGPPQLLNRREKENSFFPPLVLPSRDCGPHGVPAGLVDYDRTGRLTLTVGPEMSGQEVFQINQMTVPLNNESDMVLHRLLHMAAWQLETSLTGVLQSTHRVQIAPREHVDCHGVQAVGAECGYRDAVLGFRPANRREVTPLVWHFAGAGKRGTISHYRALFPWYTPAMRDPVLRNALLWTLVNAPPTRVFAVDATTEAWLTSTPTAPVSLLPHRSHDDLTFFQMCTYRFYEGW
ncbi:hypothetical protein ABB37_08891 [Leptomonas pyrrhocoris]|uniref:Uncharacterized protein n=1 Tax=Leptomonas pyrrhocoris TaxID=157538 RepID=A0A0M9FS92_LEPPY|nr:hypothetical protein ABB37_08891 [Leptomonas pyrrhocoris]XP_015653328.1 hypothetical protein ABB37_08891 [Leptomonas pyrrhocoris]XP_015653329.1 hypothetical protein ABB37_08891 [Leptomonas pyrrhocoris]XP_015653330.1 hypothetical protein ABB37_08891 [Leptomonas pyrrhocoris]KPA74888.1 hypothetical protein ABB37_08891 [Leptomonas pyrrhocoris]KPA74889.1 hypothetical protein ABB37_08891 [Leptomonas pyrrhocoris]KPA74890.1 hypothetical protein ABB37_08891 [Leptomonas pyrrhocoris]KPA74891.1 hypot|eukprot:XP_015653327.1 hypothetical protein ABB37_08891 [Leptomonas pyrrhocoris]